jgi:hypothetical protein
MATSSLLQDPGKFIGTAKPYLLNPDCWVSQCLGQRTVLYIFWVAGKGLCRLKTHLSGMNMSLVGG